VGVGSGDKQRPKSGSEGGAEVLDAREASLWLIACNDARAALFALPGPGCVGATSGDARMKGERLARLARRCFALHPGVL